MCVCGRVVEKGARAAVAGDLGAADEADADDPTAQRKRTRDEEDESAALGKIRSRKHEQASYGDAEEDELAEMAAANRGRTGDASLADLKASRKRSGADDVDDEADAVASARAAAPKRAANNKLTDDLLRGYKFDEKRMTMEAEIKMSLADKKLLMISLVESLVARFVVKQVPGIKRAFVFVCRPPSPISLSECLLLSPARSAVH